MTRPRVRRWRRWHSRGAVLLWTLLATAGMALMAGMTYRAMYLQWIDWRTEQARQVVRYAAHALLARCEGEHSPDGRGDGNAAMCDAPRSWTALHDAMAARPPPVRWRAARSLSENAVGVSRLTWAAPLPTTAGKGAGLGFAPAVVEAFCLREVWIDDATLGRVVVSTIRAQHSQVDLDGIARRGEEGIWLQSIVARQTAPCARTARRVLEIVEPWHRGGSS
ncbi:hypothetical protein [Robbsia sp. KACC 23696]|uniref:hypothetical protein n=1 Tax=Robbsia sp. KACC 23696 TaxID=3149231 RepID=UPI00325AC6FD